MAKHYRKRATMRLLIKQLQWWLDNQHTFINDFLVAANDGVSLNRI